MAIRDHVGGWFLYPRRPERRVDDHHLAVLRDPAAYGLTREDIERIGRRNRIGILTEVLRSGWIRVRVPPTRDAVIHIEVWNLDRAAVRQIALWVSRHGPWPQHHRMQLGVLSSAEYIETGMAYPPLRLRTV